MTERAPHEAPESKPYKVWAHTTFHLSGEAEKYQVGSFATCHQALQACRHVVDQFLQTHHQPGMTPDDLLHLYRTSGPDPHVDSPDSTCLFPARDYTREAAAALTR